MKKTLKKIIALSIIITIYIYVLVITNYPDSLIIMEGESINLKTILGININLLNGSEVIEVSSNNSQTTVNESGTKKINVSLFNNISLKNIDVDVIPKTKVIPLGNIAGVKLYTNGVLVVGMSEIEGEDNKKYKPYENTGISEGDTIIAINNKEIYNTEDLVETVNNSGGNKLKLEYVHNDETLECSITPVKTGELEYKLGLWVRDSAAGVGTVTFYEPSTNSFGALGHGIVDIDTEKLIDISSGEFITTKILNIEKGENGNPGRIQGTIDNQQTIGTITKNTKFGIYGTVDNVSALNIASQNSMEVALRDEITLGKAQIMCTLENGKTEKYEIEIENIYKNNNTDNKSMKIKVTDERLINKTGGIIQGMSGSPIIQNGKFIGAVTHVLVNNSLEGYGVFGDIMIKQLKSTT